MNTAANPYHAGYGDLATLSTAPFAGRQDSFTRLYARLFDPVQTGAILFMGRRHSGKTALLRNASNIFKATALGVYVPLGDVPADRESTWLLALAQTITTELVEQGFILSRLSQLDAPGDDVRGWLEVTFLPQILGAVRKKLLLLLDDADRLLMAVRGGQLNDDTIAYLLSLTKKFNGLNFALTLDAEYEDDLETFAPLVSPADVIRLENLALDETRWLLQAPVDGLYVVPDEIAQMVQRLVGGAPGLVQHFGYLFCQRWQNFPELNVFTRDDVRALTPAVYLYNEDDYAALWERLNTNERRVLTAISGLVYDDPLGRIDAAAIQTWLIDTDFPLDITAINATLRSLEYRDLLQPTPQGIALTAELMQTWLLEHARLGMRSPPASTATVQRPAGGLARAARAPGAGLPSGSANAAGERVSRVEWLRANMPRLLRTLTIILILLVIANVVAYAWVNGGSPTVTPDAQPTVTFAPTP